VPFDDSNAIALQIRPFGRTEMSLGNIYLPDNLAAELLQWKRECPNTSPGAFVLPNQEAGIMDTGNLRNRVPNPLAEE
jgi:hypothetical protein